MKKLFFLLALLCAPLAHAYTAGTYIVAYNQKIYSGTSPSMACGASGLAADLLAHSSQTSITYASFTGDTSGIQCFFNFSNATSSGTSNITGLGLAGGMAPAVLGYLQTTVYDTIVSVATAAGAASTQCASTTTTTTNGSTTNVTVDLTGVSTQLAGINSNLINLKTSIDPTTSVLDGLAFGWAIVVVWAIAFGVRIIARHFRVGHDERDD